MRKIYYSEVRPLAEELRLIYKIDPNNHDEVYTNILLYTLHKGGFLEDGVTQLQFNLLFNAFIDGLNLMGDIVVEQRHIANA